MTRAAPSRRPWKVRAWSYHWNDYVGSSFATRGAAEARGVLYLQAGMGKVRVWEVDERGYVVTASAPVHLEPLP